MYNRKDQIEILSRIKVPEGKSYTIDCPFCQGKKKFSITNNDGTILWNCYKASCSARGAYRKGMTLELVKRRLHVVREPLSDYLDRQITEKKIYLGKPIPEILSKPEQHASVMNYLIDNHSLEAYQSGLIKVRYAPADNRCLFFNANGEGAVGRSLDGRNPKWMSYGDTGGVIAVGKGETGVIVEDVPSACAVGVIEGYTGVAILGTNISTKQKRKVKTLKNCVIVLDNDAKKKALVLLQQLQGTLPCTVKFTTKDLKDCSKEEIIKVLNNEM